MTRKFIAPGAYVQGPDVLAEAATEFEALHARRAHVLGGETALDTVGTRLVDALEAGGVGVATVEGGVTQCTHEVIDTHVDRVRESDADLVVGVGGGVAQDVATAVAHHTGATHAAVPTIASTDAPCSTVAVIYDDDGRCVDHAFRERNPELVLVDTAVIADAPARFLRHGMGDAVATHFEARAVSRSGATTDAGGQSSHAAVDIAERAYRRVAEYGPDALAAVSRDAVTPAVERVVEANTLLSGLGFESGGTAGAHAVQVGLTNVGVDRPHGVLVAFGTVAELVLQDRDPAELADLLDCHLGVGLDATLEDFGVDDDQVERAGEIACEMGMEDERIDPSPERVADAIRAADAAIADRRN